MTTENPELSSATPKHYSGRQVAFFILLAVLISVGITGIVVYGILFPSEFTPVELSEREQQRLDAKLRQLGVQTTTASQGNDTDPGRLQPETYSEEGASREINLSEKELNSLLASNAVMAQRFAIDLSRNLASAKLLVPLDPEFPVLGGKTIVVTAGLELAFQNGRPIVVLQGVSLWGVPVPNAWLGGMKNVDLVQEFGNGRGFWSAFVEGVESIEVEDGELHIVLKE